MLQSCARESVPWAGGSSGLCMVAADGSRGWPQSFQRYNTIYNKHFSQDICGDRASVNIIYTQTVEGAGLDPPLLQSSHGWNLRAGRKYHWFAFTSCTYIYE